MHDNIFFIDKIKEMVYSAECKIEILVEGFCGNFPFCIVSYGTHPCCYVGVGSKHPFYDEHYDSIDLNCHGGITYAERSNDIGSKIMKNYYVLGWDYAHIDDYMGYYNSEVSRGLSYSKWKKWTTEELLEEIKKVVQQLDLNLWEESYN